jgi:hypothetical protein
MSKFHIFGGDWVIQPVKTEKLRGIKLFYPPGSSLTRQALIWGSFRVFFARLPRKRVGGSAGRRVGGSAFAKSRQIRPNVLVTMALSKSSFPSPDADTPIRRYASISGTGH